MFVGEKGSPVLEHYIPKSSGGRKVVLACQWCDKVKAMIHGPVFEDILQKHTTDAGKTITQAAAAINAECKSLNAALYKTHVPKRGVAQQPINRKLISWAYGEPPPAKLAAVFPDKTQAQLAREKFWASFDSDQGAKPHTGDRHYQGWTGKNPTP